MLPDSVYLQTLVDCNNNLPQAAKTCAMYILGALSQKTHKKLAQLEYWGAEAFEGYRSFLMLAFTNPTFLDYTPLPYSASSEFSPILDFQRAWNSSFNNGTEAQQLSFYGDVSANPNTRLGVYGYPYVPV